MMVRTLPLSLLMTSGLAALAACGDDEGGSGEATVTLTEADTSAGSATMTGPDTMTTEDSMTTADTTADTMTTVDTMTTEDSMTTVDPDTSGDPPGEVMAYRFTSLFVRDPHFFATTVIGCVDVTDMVPLMEGASVNEQFNAAITQDDPMTPDGNLDLSLLMLFRPLDQADGASGAADFANGACLIPANATVCSLLPNTMLHDTPYTSQAAGLCHMADPAHLSSENYTPTPGSTMGPCFHAGPADVQIVTTSFNLPLDDAEIAGTYAGDPATSIMSGTLRGFLSVASATATVLPADLQESTGATTVADLLPGSTNSCAGHSDLDGDGWWFYADFTAEPVPWNE